MSGVRKEEMYKSTDPVHGETKPHTTAAGAKAEEVWHGVKSSVPGTTEYQATHGTGATGTGTGMGTGMGTTTGTTGATHMAQNPVTGETHTLSTQTGAKLDQAFQDVKQKIPGTTEHRATHPSGTTMGTTTRGTTYDEPATRPL